MTDAAKITVLRGQTLEDVALMHYGAIEGVEMLLRDNRDELTEGFDTPLINGMALRVRPSEIIDPKVVNRLRNREVIPASAPPQTPSNE